MFFMTPGAPNKLPNFQYNNTAIKNSASVKLLGVIVDNKLDFTQHQSTICKKANLKLYALKISRTTFPNNIAFIKSLSNFCHCWFECSAIGRKFIKLLRSTSLPYFYC